MEGTCQKCAQSTTRPCSNLFSVLVPPCPSPSGLQGKPTTRRNPHDRDCGPPILDPCDVSHGPLPGLFGFEGGSSSNGNLPLGVGTQSSRKCAHVQGNT